MASLLEKMRINTWESCGIIQFSGKPDTILVVQNRSQWYKTGVCSQCSAKREKERERERARERERERKKEGRDFATRVRDGVHSSGQP